MADSVKDARNLPLPPSMIVRMSQRAEARRQEEEMPLTGPGLSDADHEEWLSEGKDIFDGMEVAEEHLCSDGRAAVNLMKATIGSGVLALPYAFMNGTLVFSLVGCFIIWCITTYCMIVLVRCKDKLEHRNARTYGDLAFHTYGRAGSTIVEILLGVTQTGFCVAYLLFISKSLKFVVSPFKELVSGCWWLQAHLSFILLVMSSLVFDYPTYQIVVAMLVPFVLIFTLLRHMRYLAPTSLAANIALLAGMIIIAYFALRTLSDHPKRMDTVNFTDFDITTYPIFFGIAVYAFEGIGLILPIHSSMKKPAHFPRVLVGTLGSAGLMYLIFGCLVYIGFGDNVKSVLTTNLPPNWVATTVQLVISFALFFTYPIQLFPVSELLENHLVKDSLTSSWVETKKNMIRVFLVLLTALLAILLPRFGLIISFLGATGSTALGFVFPALFHLKLFRANMSVFVFCLDIFLIVFGIVSGAAGTYVSVLAMAQT